MSDFRYIWLNKQELQKYWDTMPEIVGMRINGKRVYTSDGYSDYSDISGCSPLIFGNGKDAGYSDDPGIEFEIKERM